MPEPLSDNPKNSKVKSIDDKIDLVEASSKTENKTPPKDSSNPEPRNATSPDTLSEKESTSNSSMSVEVKKPSVEGFEILELIGQGGMGAVFKARKNETGEEVAIKVLSSDLLEDVVALKRFKQEAQAASRLSHTNLVNVNGYGTTIDGIPFLEMEYFDGPSLSSIISEEGFLATEKALEILCQICDGLSYAHKNGIIHRDIKPSNVIVLQDTDGSIKVKLLDFGIALVRSQGGRETQDLTKTGDVLGSPQYMSPEQCLGFMLDARSDIYSLGCVIYELVTGKPPFAGENPVQLVVSHINEKVPAFKSEFRIGKKVKNLEKVAKRCLHKEQSDRYQTAAELKSDLEKVRRGQSVDTYAANEKVKASFSNEQIMFAYAGIFAIVFIAVLAIPEYVPSNIGRTTTAALCAIATPVVAIIFAYLGIKKLKFLLAKKGTIRQWMLMSFSLSLGAVFACTFPFFLDITLSNLTSYPQWVSLICQSFLVVSFIFCCSSIASFIGYFLGRSSEKVSSLFCKIWIPICTCVLVLGSFFAFPKYMSGFITSTADKAEDVNPSFALNLHRFNEKFLPVNRYTRLRSIYLLQKEKSYNEAIKDVTALLEKDESLNLLGIRMNLYFKTDQFQNARSDIKKARKIDAENRGYGRILEARMLFKEKKPVQSLAVLNKSIRAYPDYSNSAYRRRASVNYSLGRNELAFKDLDTICKLGSQKRADHVIRGIFRQQLGQDKEAKLDFQKALDLNKRLIEQMKKNNYSSSFGYSGGYSEKLALSYAAKQLGKEKEYKSFLKEAENIYYKSLDKDLINQLDLEESGIKLNWPPEDFKKSLNQLNSFTLMN